MKYLITGVAGFVGSSIADRLLLEGHEVLGIDCYTDYYKRSFKENNLVQARDHQSFQFVDADLVDLANSARLKPLLAEVDVVFHQAAQAGVRSSWGNTFSLYTHNNILATQVLLEQAKGLSNIKKIVYASSSSVYGNAESFPTKENILPSPVSPYGVSKLAAEHLMSLYAHEFNVPTTSLRYFTVFGPRQRPDMAFNRWIRQALQKQPITLYGDGSQSRDFTFISDIVEANLLAARSGQIGRAYNIGGGTQASVNSVLEFLAAQIGPLKIEQSDRQKGDARHTSADCSLAKVDLGFQPKVSLQQGLAAEIEWMQSVLASNLADSF